MKYSPVTDTPEIVLAKKNAQLVSKVKLQPPITAAPWSLPCLSSHSAFCLLQLNYTADYEKTKHQYTLSKDLPQIKTAKANAALCSDVSQHVRVGVHGLSFRFPFFNWTLPLQIKYKEEWEKTKTKACDISVDDLSVRAAKASRDLASDVSQHTFKECKSLSTNLIWSSNFLKTYTSLLRNSTPIVSHLKGLEFSSF